MADRGMLPNREDKRWPRQLPGPPLPRLVSTHHTRHDRAELPGHPRPPTSREKRGPIPDPDAGKRRTTTDQKIVRASDSAGRNHTPPLRRRIRLTLAEARRLFNVRDQTKHVIH